MGIIAPPMTAENLKVEARRNRTGPAGKDKSLSALPEVLTFALDAILSDFSYFDHMKSNAAIGCRILAAIITSLEESDDWQSGFDPEDWHMA